MPLRLIEIQAVSGHADKIAAIAEQFDAVSFRTEPASAEGIEAYRIVARPERQQELIDRIQSVLGKDKPWRILIMPIEAMIPELEVAEPERRSPEQATREELYAEIERGARIDSTYLLLVGLSTIVAAIGLLENSVAIVIAAMLIAPLFGPNVAMALGSTLGDRELVARAALTNLVGIALSVAGAAAAGALLPVNLTSVERLARTQFGYDSILLALASGAAGALSLTTRLPGTLVGVMVAVALLPPAVTFGYLLGAGQIDLAGGAGTLLAVNIVCVNLSAQLVFFAKGIKPRTWIERRAAQESTRIGFMVSGGLLALLVVAVWWRQG